MSEWLLEGSRRTSEWLVEIDDAYVDDLIFSEACTIKQPLVRCKDCINHVKQSSDDDYICRLMSTEEEPCFVEPCDFCAWGEPWFAEAYEFFSRSE